MTEERVGYTNSNLEQKNLRDIYSKTEEEKAGGCSSSIARQKILEGGPKLLLKGDLGRLEARDMRIEMK